MIKKGLLIKISIFVLSSILSFIVLEISYRYTIFGSDSLNYEKMNSVTPLGLSGLIEPSRDREIVYQLKPNLNTYFKMARFKTNSEGLRDKEYSMTKPKNTIRVAVVGDSLTMPAGVNIEDAYHSILEEKFKTSCPSENYEFINFAVGGYYLSQYWAVIRKRIMDWDPDMIVIGFCEYNDFESPPDKLFEGTYKVKEKGHPFFFQSFAISSLKQFLKNLGKKDMHKNQRIDGNSTFTEEQVDYMRKVFSMIGAFSTEKKIPIVVGNLGITPSEQHELESIVTNSGLYYVDLTPSFEGTKISEYSIFRTDNHPNSKANLVFANAIKEYLDKNKLIECSGSNIDHINR
ncbi:MAG TPA: SGNH/GDSL hydrolase family protein [Thermodesulfobacteriota bacterium]